MVSAGCAYKLAGGSPRCRGGNLAHESIRNCNAQKSPHPPLLKKGGMKPINISSSPFAKGGPRGILME